MLPTERGIEVCAPIHDALLISARIDTIEPAVAVTREAMAEASQVVLNGFEVRTEAKVTRYLERFTDARGTRMWDVAAQLIEEAEAVEAGTESGMSDDTNNPFHPKNIGLGPELLGSEVWAKTPAKIKKRRELFTMVPGIWKERLTKARYVATYRVALHILARDWENGGRHFTLSNAALALEGVKRGTKWRALGELEQLELIAIERRKRKSPQITVLHTNPNRGA